MADENVIIEDNEQNVGEYDPNPYDNVTVEEALKQLFNRFTPRTVRQAIFTMAENNKPATLIEKTVTSNDTYVATDDDADGYSKVTVDVAGGGGGETFEVEMTFTVDSLQNPQTVSYTSTKKLPEVINAIDSGKKVDFAINITDGTESVNLPLFGYAKYIEDDIVSIFISTYEGSRPDKPTFIAWAADNTTPSLTGFTTQVLIIPPAN